MEGLLNLIKEIKSKDKLNFTVNGISFFFSKTTAERFGFQVKKASLINLLNFSMNYFILIILCSFSENKIIFPNILKIKEARISAKNLIDNENKIQIYYNYLLKRQRLI